MDASTDKGMSPRSHVVRHLIVMFSALLLLALAIALGSLYRIAAGLDEREAVESRFHATSALTQLQDRERSYLLGHAFWQAAYDHLNAPEAAHWAFDQDNIGPTLYTQDGYQGVYAFNDRGTLYAMLDGQLSDQGLAVHTAGSAQILAVARQAVQRGEAASGFLLFDGAPALFSAAVIRPPAQPHHLEAPSSVLVFIRRLDATVLEGLGRTAGLSGVTTTSSAGPVPERGSLPLEGIDQQLTWRIAQPGAELLRTVIPPLGLASLIMALIMGVTARYAMRASASIDRSQQQALASRAALQSSESRFKAVAEAASDWIWETDAALNISYLSGRFATVTGHPLEQWLGRPITDLLDCDTGDVQNWLQGLVTSHMVASLRCQYHDRLNQRRICRITASAILERAQCQGFRGTCSDITDEVAAHAQIQHLSMHDALTGLPNRNQLMRFLEQDGKGSGAVPLAVLMLDLDNFKPVNDSLGHAAGDAVLIELAARLGRSVRDGDLVARLGGDEFVIVLVRPGARVELERFAERVIATLQQPIDHEGHRLQVGVSLGIALSSEYPGAPSELIRCADAALYAAKREGKHTWRFFSADLNSALHERRLLERDLRSGIERGELVLHFQPRFKLDGTTIASVESLVRWQHPQHGLLMPDRFIALAEESDLIVLLGNWVLNEACARALDWPLPVTVSVNLSPAQFTRSDVVHQVRQALTDSTLPAQRLELEITENVMLNDIEGALQTFNALKELGVRLNMDDFGTGYSSLGYLRTYPFDSIKIDKRFIQAVASNSSDRRVVQAIISLGTAMNMTVTAEGVETPEQLAVLHDDQCHEVQGYLLSRPVEHERLVQLMRAQPPARD
ncbi:EAL domain-containing protein [Pseudomonas sp. RP23018S]|uniref:bifunctional diguanylate cyclase/phosphodiesterase n=1 Tax=Pseudomonas sp. RP23018S TaxID=3096037 RepID=UPI002AC9F45C|nr:EAL domain-containing protein [Pseudomonas sp. RP23018S]MDZ5603630.1 EAL domain-containing protein [Pseudomonas sp. RP23018S]